MKPTRFVGASAALLSAVLALAAAPAARAVVPVTTPDFDFTVNLNVASLNLNPNGPFSLDLQFVTGSGNVANTVKVYNFATTGTGGGFTGTTYSGGSETGSIAPNGIVTLTNAQSINELAAGFAAGTQTISFNVDETPNSEVVGTGSPLPDQFNIAILDGNLGNIPTTDPSNGNTLVISDLGEESTLQSFSSLSPDGGVTAFVATPEPGSFALSLVAAAGVLGLTVLRRRSAA